LPIDINASIATLDLNLGSTVKVDRMTRAVDNPTADAPNHHGHHPGFSGLSGLIAAVSMSFGRHDAAELAMNRTGLESGDRIIDIGCGPGIAARQAALRGATVTGVDPADIMLAVARRADRKRAVTWRRGAAEALPLSDSSCDVAWSLSTVHHWRDLDKGLSEVHRVLTTAGRFLATERRVKPDATGLASHGWTDGQAEAFGELCSSAGFATVEVTRHHSERGIVLAVSAHRKA
jgi:ubiquinone/menaquinone biosynthesis C-methylase UbiE